MELSHVVDPAALPPGTLVGSWRVLNRGSRGAYGVVYRVEEVGHEEAGSFALKLALHPLDPRFEREAELLSRIRHPQVPRLQGRGWWMGPEQTPFPYLVMEWVEGVSLYEWALRHRLTSRQGLRLLAQVARAVEATHAVGGVHRDIKGDNVLVRESDATAMLMDFGLGIFRGAPVLTSQLPPPGTREYQSPEALHFQWRHLRQLTTRYEARPADDVYALGVMAYRLVTGRYPPVAVDVEGTEQGPRWVQRPLVPPERWVSLDAKLSALIVQMLAHEPSARGSAGEVAQALERAARQAGREADQLIMPLQRRVSARRAAQPVPPRQTRAWRWGLAVVAAGVLLAVLGRAASWQPMGRPEEVARQEPDKESPDAGPARIADTALSARVEVEATAPGQRGIRVDMPKNPLPGQRLPPCSKPETEINGGCWKRLADEVPPCADNSFEWKSSCYAPSLSTSRPSASEPE
ncbi:MAG: serine/threonine protein kinase [Hyalangium sp.]|uniref:serine/threonine protein kinase n=1 Tax=Hyalangium sp. TaxID=2028555 RepID=UPI003899AE95